MRLDKQDNDEDDGRGNGRRARPPLFDSSMARGNGPVEKDKPAESGPSDRNSDRLTKRR